MFAAVALFVLLLLGMLYIAFIRFRNPRMPATPPAAMSTIEPPASLPHLPTPLLSALGDHSAPGVGRSSRERAHG
jgi:hypothetical protein